MKLVLKLTQAESIDTWESDAKDMIKSIRGDSVYLKMDFIWKELQQHVDHVLDRDMNKSTSSKSNTWGFKQVIERKQGLFR